MLSPSIVVDVKGICLDRKDVRLISDSDFSLHSGVVTGLVGPNGAGKSTLMSALLGDLYPTSGAITVDGVPLKDIEIRSRIFGVQTASYGLPEKMKVKSIFTYIADINDVPVSARQTWFEYFGLADFEHKKIKALSTGMCRRVELAIAFMVDTPVLVLDEPFNGLDIDYIRAVRRAIVQKKSEGVAVLLVTHTFGEVNELCDEVYALKGQKVVKVEDFQKQTGNIEDSYDVLFARKDDAK